MREYRHIICRQLVGHIDIELHISPVVRVNVRKECEGVVELFSDNCLSSGVHRILGSDGFAPQHRSGCNSICGCSEKLKVPTGIIRVPSDSACFGSYSYGSRSRFPESDLRPAVAPYVVGAFVVNGYETFCIRRGLQTEFESRSR